jgi:hypothetical protein
MSRPNKANKNNYTQRGRLTPDEMARERVKQAGTSSSRANDKEILIGKAHAPGERAPSRPRSAPEERD